MAEDAETAESALRENINRKGSNSYYYAHGATATGPAWDGKEQPRLLATSIQPTTVKKVPTNSFDSYSWVDEVKNVKVYIDFENASDIADEAISLTTDDTSLEFSILVDGKSYCLHLDPLNDSVASASFRKKASSFVITLKKATATPWENLKKSS
ncbi:hypothetical protein B484DRAFT_424535 [Ochromonadaceae sp. CCMP2298]|nr:hypothetical protein B484DRAFT_424535 [Ochromonadaceae sp. CCMP2298]|mmetsp:Transcript_11838/g.26297  ORF Transcript_11838/g.26297 Transcript_11838/m.26297 type:complete len:155 (-) Transcript_11838:64-528(-)|eukprot:CAMPEP_0173227920 /NCGR_PEP_ID=MMETSP1142-20121109/6233_1 /TAXON_ID=483371 /ORGANISM="non described non described, Strain CCMP2298" /LENGTH=154 /DNA_ID=CAMNT_0014156493 /DNA_START=66 /DNA_END=530 /DNA_ORIENTATION=-